MARKSSSLAKVLILLGLFVVIATTTFLVVGVYAYNRFLKKRGDDPALLAAERAADRIEAAEAFRDPSPPTEIESKEFAEALNTFFKDLQKQPTNALDKHFDIGRLVVELERNGMLERFDFKMRMSYTRASFVQGFGTGMRTRAPLLAETFNWDETKIRRIRRSTDGKEAVVIATHVNSSDDEQVQEKIRWWLVRNGQSWKIYDFENLTAGIRLTSETVRLFSPQAMANLAQIQMVSNPLMQMFRGIQNSDINETESALRVLRNMQLIDIHMMLRNLGEGYLAILKEQPALALPFFDLVEKDYPDMPLLKIGRATALFQLERYDDSLVNVHQYLDLVGPDCMGYLLEGKALDGLDKHDDAIESYRKAVIENPNNPDAFSSLQLALPKNRKSEILEYVMSSRKLTERFNVLFNQNLYQDTEFAESLCKEFCKKRPDDSVGMIATSRLLAKQGKINEGVKAFRRGYERTEEISRSHSINMFIYAFPNTVDTLELYKTLADLDRRSVFRTLTNQLTNDFDDEDSNVARPKKDEKQQKTLEEMISLHAKADPDDPWIDYQRGLIAEEKNDLAKADTHFLAAEKKLPAKKKLTAKEQRELKEFDSSETITVRNARISNWYRQGKGIDAFVEFGSNEDIFQSLIYRYQTDKNAVGLGQLLELYEHNHKDDVNITYWRGEIAWIKKDYEAVAELNRDYFRLLLLKPDNEKFHYEYSASERLVRSLVRLKKEAEAEAMFLKYGQEHRNLKILIAASRGNIEKVISEMTAMKEEKYGTTDWLYNDEDLGPLLKSAPFKAVRDKFPEPKPQKAPETDPKTPAKPSGGEEKPVSPKPG